MEQYLIYYQNKPRAQNHNLEKSEIPNMSSKEMDNLSI